MHYTSYYVVMPGLETGFKTDLRNRYKPLYNRNQKQNQNQNRKKLYTGINFKTKIRKIWKPVL